MFYNNLNLKRSVVFTWVISYIVVFVVPVLGGMVMFFGMQRKVLRETEANNILLLRQSVENLDSMLMETERIGAMLELNTDVYEYTYLPSENHILKLYKLQEIKKFLASCTLNLSRNNVHVALYFGDIDMFLTGNSAYTSQEYYECFLSKEQSFEDWHKQLNSISDRNFFQSKFAFDEENISNSIKYCTRIPYSGNEKQKISLFVEYNAENYLDFLHKIQFATESAVVISDKSGNEIFSYNLDNIPEELQTAYRQYSDTENKSQMRNKNGYSVISISSEVSGWKYSYFIPLSKFQAEYRKTLYLFICEIIGVLLLGIALIRFLIKKNYLPLQNMLVEYNIKKDKSQNEFVLIKDFLSQNMEEKTRLISTIEQQKSIVQKSYLTKMMNGEVKCDASTSEILQEIDITFMDGWEYIVVMITVENTDDFFEGETKLDAFERAQLINSMFENILNELTEKSYNQYTLPYDGSIFCIIGAENISEQIVFEMMKYAQNVFDSNFGIQFSAAISGMNYGYDGIAKGTRQAIEATEYRVLGDGSSIILYSDVDVKKNNTTAEIDMDEKFFSGLLEKGEAEVAKEYLQSLLMHKLYDEKITAGQFKCMLYKIANAFLCSIAEIYRSGAKAVLLQEKLIDAMENKFSFEEYCKIFSDLTDRICEDTVNVAQNQDIVIQIKDYIMENYSNANLNINHIAEVFNLSNGYVSGLFRKEENTGILDYIGMVRITKAKELLKETCMTLEEVYPQVGFTNKSTFIRVFKKQTGMTPMQYRNCRVI